MKSIRAWKDNVGDCQVLIFCSRRSVSDVLASRRHAATAVASLEYVRMLAVEQTAHEWVTSPLQGEAESEGPFPSSDTPHLNPLPSARGEATKDQQNELQLLKAKNQ